MLASRALLALPLAVVLSVPLAAQSPADPAETAGSGAGAPSSPADETDPEAIDPAEPDFTLVNLPTGLDVPRMKGAFRVTHRFARPLGRGDLGELLENFFGFDSGAQIGLEYRFGLTPAAHVGIYRTSERTIQFFGQYRLRRASADAPFAAAVVAAAEGMNNFREEYSPSAGAVVSYRFGSRAVVYAQPMWVGNTNHDPLDPNGDDYTLMAGVGGRVNVHGPVYLVIEVAPRIAGHTPGSEHASFAVEHVVGGHVFQINFSNGIGSTRGQIARGGSDDWFIGFNISRKLW